MIVCSALIAPQVQERSATGTAIARETQIAQAATDDAMKPTFAVQTDVAATNFALTPPTATPTITDTARPSPSATITDTPAPSPTGPPSVTPEPAIEITPIEPVVYYVTGTANIRECPSTECDALGQYRAGQGIGVDGATVGEAVNGNRTWYRTMFQGETGYIHSSLISFVAPAPTRPPVQQQAVSTPVPQPISTPVQQGPVSPFGCNGQDDLNCSDFRSIGQNANAHLAVCGDEDNLDQDGDGHACES
jgi:hypothetical protein